MARENGRKAARKTRRTEKETRRTDEKDARREKKETRRAARAPRRARAALSRWNAAHPLGLWIVGAATVAAILYSIAAPLEATLYGAPVLVALFVTAARCVALVGAVRFPATSIAVFALAAFAPRVLIAPAGVPWPWTVTTIIEFAALVVVVWGRHGWRLGIIAYLAPGLAISALTPFAYDPRSLSTSIVALSVGAAAAGVGALLAERVRIAAELSRQRRTSQDELERRLVVEERQRIAREMHDVVAHGLSLIQVQAMSARFRMPGIDERVAGEFEDIARAARSSLAEMRRLLGALRGDASPVEHAPQPTLSDIPSLVEEARRAGAEVRLSLDADADVPVAVGIAVYRIVQESISNAVRHAPGAVIAIAVGRHDGRLVVDVTNAVGRDTQTSPRAAGHGLVGMRERASLLGGYLVAGPTGAGTFRVAGTLPLDEAPREGEAAG